MHYNSYKNLNTIREVSMKNLIKSLSVMILSIFIISCGQESNNNSNNNFKEFINSNNGVEFKKPSKVNIGQNAFVSNQQISDILLTLDNDGSYHLRSSVPTNVSSNQTELEGIKGEWKVSNEGLIELYRGNTKVATSNQFYNNGSSNNSLSLNFIQNVQLDIINTANNFFNNNIVTFNTTQINLQGFITVIR